MRALRTARIGVQAEVGVAFKRTGELAAAGCQQDAIGARGGKFVCSERPSESAQGRRGDETRPKVRAFRDWIFSELDKAAEDLPGIKLLS
jgi:hypothetical protein